MKTVIEKLPSTLGYSASATTALTIGARQYFITGMLFDFEFVYNTGAATTTANISQDIPWRGILAMSIIGGGRPYVSIGAPDARSLYWHNRLKLNGRARFPTLATTSSTAGFTAKYTLPILFGVNPVKVNDSLNIPTDTSAAIAPDTDLTLSITWSAAGSTTTSTLWGANYGIDTLSLVRVSLLGYVPSTAAEEPKFYPAWRTNQYSPTQTASGLSSTVNLDPGYYYRRSTVMILNGSTSATPPVDRRTDSLSAVTAVSEVGVQTADGRFPVQLKTYEASQLSQAEFLVADDNTALSNAGSQGATAAYMTNTVAASYNPGVFQWDWVALADTMHEADPLYGLNMLTKSAGAVKMAYTVDASTNTTINHLHECYLPY